MTTVAHKTQAVPTRAPLSSTNIQANTSAAMAPSTSAATAAANGVKKKGKKTPDPLDAKKQLEAKIAQLELDAAGEKDQEAEIGGFLPVYVQMKISFGLYCQMSMVLSGISFPYHNGCYTESKQIKGRICI